MKKIIIILFLLNHVVCFSQTNGRRVSGSHTNTSLYSNGTPRVDNGLVTQAADTVNSAYLNKGTGADALPYLYNGKTWTVSVTDSITVAYVSDTTSLKSYTGTATIVLMGGAGGGIFDSSSSTVTPNAGIVFNRFGSGSWIRDTSQASMINAKWFGVDPSINDNSVAEQAAINYVSSIGGGRIYFPKGIYKGNFTLKNKVSIIGENMTATTFKSAHNTTTNTDSNAAVMTMDTLGGGFLTLEGFQIAGNDTLPKQIGIDFSKCHHVCNNITFNRLEIDTCGSFGIYMYGTGASADSVHDQNFNFYDCRITRNDSAGIRLKGNNLENHFYGCFIDSNGTKPGANNFELLSGSGGNNYPLRTEFFGGVISSSNTPGAGIYITGSENAIFTGVDMENGNPTFRIAPTNIENARNIQIQNCSFYLHGPLHDSSAIVYTMVNGLRVENNSFHLADTSKLAHIVNDSSSTGNGRHVVVTDDNTIYIEDSSLITSEAYKYAITGASVSNYAIRAYQGFMIISNPNAKDTLKNVFDADSAQNFYPGQVVTLALKSSSNKIFIQSDSGNIHMAMGNFWMTDQRNTLTLVWDGLNNFWRQAGRDERIDSITASPKLNKFYGFLHNVDTATANVGAYYVDSTTTGTLPGSWGSATGTLNLLVTDPSGTWTAGVTDATEFLFRANTNVIYYRINPRSTGTWGTWDSIWKASNITGASPIIWTSSTKTISIDTTIMTTKVNRQKLADSLSAIITPAGSKLSILTSTAAGSSVPVGGTQYLAPGDASLSSTETSREVVIPFTGNLRNFYVVTNNGQTGGTLTCTVRKNEAITTLTIGISGAAGTYSDTTHVVSVTAGDRISFQFANPGTSTSAAINSYSLQITN